MIDPLHVRPLNIGNRESFLARVNDILDRRWLSNNGPVMQEFEKRVAEVLGINHALAQFENIDTTKLTALTTVGNWSFV